MGKENDKLKKQRSAPAAPQAQPMAQPAAMAQASPMGQTAPVGQPMGMAAGTMMPGQTQPVVENTGIWMPGMQPGYTDPDTVGLGQIGGTIGPEQVRAAMEKLNKYKQGKTNLEQRIIENEKWFRLRHWESLESTSQTAVKPVSAWLLNCIANKHADAMDNFPSPNILPREEGDKAEAQMLSSIIPVILDQTEFEEVYDEVWDYKLKMGTGVYGVFWEQSKLNGLGDITIRKVDLLNLFWEPGITDIQHSRNLFHVELRDNDLLEAEYPQLKGNTGDSSMVSKYEYDDSVDTQNKSAVIDWYYKKRVGEHQVLHYCKFVGETVLYASENDPTYAERGWYDHGMYPFVFDRLFKTAGTPCGFGYIDVGNSAQEYIDRGNQAIMMNMLANAKPRYFVRQDGAVNEKEYADTNKEFIHVDGNLGQDSILPVQGKSLNDIYVQVIKDKIDELKETTGNRDISTGGTSHGVTAASAIAAMQEAGSKLSRDHSKASYRAFRKVCIMVIELIRQFYNAPRSFRIMGNNGAQKFVSYSNQGIIAQSQGVEMGVNLGYRLPQFDIEVSAQKASPYSKMSQNELALQFFGAGFFNPQLADQALACVEMMDFDRKDFIMQRIAQNGEAFRQQQMMAMMGIPGMGMSTMGGGIIPGVAPNAQSNDNLGGESTTGESAVTKNARQRVAESSSPT